MRKKEKTKRKKKEKYEHIKCVEKKEYSMSIMSRTQ